MASEWIKERKERQLEGVLTSEELTEDQRETLREFDQRNVLRGVSLRTRLTYLYRARRLARFLGDKPFTDVTREDLEAYLADVAERTSQNNVRQDKVFLRMFYGVLNDPNGDDKPDLVSWIQPRPKRQKLKLPDELLTPAEIKQMAEAATHPRDTAIVMGLYESAARASEFCGLTCRDIVFDQYGARLQVDGKTGQRKIRLINAVPALRDWLNHHPWHDDPDAPLFIRLNDTTEPLPLLNHGLAKVLKKTARTAGIDKRIHPHLFRHSRLTELAKDLSESELKVVAGWAPDSSMAKTYIHLSGGDVDKKILRKAGLLDEDDEDYEDALEPEVCLRCETENAASASYCSKCSLPLDKDERQRLIEEDDKLREKLPLLLELVEDPEVAQLLERKADETDSRAS